MDETTSTAVATPTPSSTPSAPSTPAPAAEPVSTPTARPSFRTALKDAETKLATPLPTEPAATVPGAGETPITKPGPIQFEDHKKVIDNTRTKTRAEVENEYRQKYGEPSEIEQNRAWRHQAQANPGAFVERMLTDALSDPVARPQAMSVLGRMLGAMRKPAAPQTPSGPPAPDFKDDAGNEFYSAKALRAVLDAQKAQILQEIDPLKQEVEGTRAAREEAEQQRQLQSWSTSTLTKAKSWPHFAEHQAEIAAALAEMPPTSGHPAEEALALREAWEKVVLPKLSELEQNKVVAHLNEKAAASTLNPANTGAPSGIPKSVRAKDGGTFGAALKWAEQQNRGR